ncbi:glutathione peroxidase [Beggiatoa alba]|nr:glutathione peroxidase [Beggiatoa alba]
MRQNDEWKNLTTDDLFSNKTVVVFSLPGAFTPTCSSSHLPRFNELASTFADNGVDDIICMSVNDTFVMNAWKQDQAAENITIIPDGNGYFTRAMGMLVEKTDLGFGERSWRYSMLVKNGVIEKMFIEDMTPGDPFEVSDADTMLNYINPNAKTPDVISLFTRKNCSHCARAKAILDDRGQAYEVIELNKNITEKSLVAVTGATSVPQIYINGKQIGGADKLESYFKKTA